MARIELRDATFRLVDGHANTALVNDTPANGDTDVDIDTLGTSALIPVSSRFTTPNATGTYTVTAQKGGSIYTVALGGASGGTFTLTAHGHISGAIAFDALASAVKTAILAASGQTLITTDVTVTGTAPNFIVTFTGTRNELVTTLTGSGASLTGGTFLISTVNVGAKSYNITFTPAISTAAGIPGNNDAITFTGRTVEAKLGDGNLTYTENKEYNYELDRGDLDTVREGNQIPIDVTMDFVWEFLVAIDGATTPTLEDAFKNQGPAAGWVSSSSDACEPYCVDIEVEHIPPCGGEQREIVTLPDFRHEKLAHNVQNAQVSATGRCNATQAIIVRAV